MKQAYNSSQISVMNECSASSRSRSNRSADCPPRRVRPRVLLVNVRRILRSGPCYQCNTQGVRVERIRGRGSLPWAETYHSTNDSPLSITDQVAKGWNIIEHLSQQGRMKAFITEIKGPMYRLWWLNDTILTSPTEDHQAIGRIPTPK